MLQGRILNHMQRATALGGVLQYANSKSHQALRRTAISAATCGYSSSSTAPLWIRRWSSSDANHRIYKSSLPSIISAVEEEKNLYSYMMKRMKKADPQKIACLQAETGQSFTYPQLIQITERVAQILYCVGHVRKGDVVCLSMLNTVMYGPLVYGSLRLGAVVSTVNAVAAPGTLAYHFKTNNAKVVLGMRFFQKALEDAVEIVKKETGRTITVIFPEDFMKMKDKFDIPADYDGLADSSLDDTVFIPFSSGTSGLPKGVQLTNRALIANSEQAAVVFGFSNLDVSISVLPFFHIFGFTCCMNVLYAFGGTQVVMMKYSIDTYIDLIEKYKATVNLVAPPILVSILKNADKLKGRDVSSLIAIRSGAAPLGGDMEHMCEALLPGCSVSQGYGMTEMSPVVSALPRKVTKRTYGGSGILVADTELRIVKVDDSQQSGADESAGIDAEPGKEGEVWVRGPQMMKSYLKAEDTAGCIQDGWYRTGDIGWFNEETGELLITDRLKELIKYKGFQVSPAGLEAALLSHPWVKDCIVVGVPDPRDVSFENPRALVVLKDDLPTKDAVRASDELYRYVMSRMPPHKRLHGGVRIVDEVPRNVSGKLLRRQARQQEVALLKASLEERKASSMDSSAECA